MNFWKIYVDPGENTKANDTFHPVTLSQCLAKIHFNLSNIFQNILKVQYISLLGLIDTYFGRQTFIRRGKAGYCFRDLAQGSHFLCIRSYGRHSTIPINL